MKTQVLFLLLLLLAAALPAQEPKGVLPIAPPSAVNRPPSTVRAVVVGISDYQSPKIPDLQYADRDALAFADWLKSAGGGNVPPANITLLLNTEATMANFATALDGLLSDSKEGDLAVVYFSGHGDVERKTISQPGYLLCRDAPATCYMSGGAFNLRDLQEVVSTLSVQNKARVLVITDACHAGKLAGTDIGGTQLTNQNLIRQFANEVKIMSCQPNEFSLEGEQWGGGRGCFSYHLLEGLTGLADRNADGRVSLLELDAYLKEKVSTDAAPANQIPLVVGSLTAEIARVDPSALAALKKAKASEPDMALAPGNSKGMETAVLLWQDSSTKKMYADFQQALHDGNLLQPEGASAWDLYVLLSDNQDLQPLHGLMRRNLAAAFQNEVQQAINALLDSDPYEVSNWQFHPGKYAQYPRYLEHAIELLGKQHYLYPALQAKKCYFEAYLLTRNDPAAQKDSTHLQGLRRQAKDLLLEAIGLDSNAAYLYHAIAVLYQFNYPAATDSVRYYCQQAMEKAPNWLLPFLDLSYEYSLAKNDYQTAEQWLLRALEKAPDSYLTLERLAWLNQWRNQTDDAIAICLKMIDMKPELFNAYATLGRTYWIRCEPENQEKWARRSLDFNPCSWAITDYGEALFRQRRASDAIRFLKGKVAQCTGQHYVSDASWSESIAGLVSGLILFRHDAEALTYIRLEDSLRITTFYHVWTQTLYGKLLILQNRDAEAENVLQHALTIDPTPNALYGLTYALLGVVEQRRGRLQAAEDFFEKGTHYNGDAYNAYMDVFTPQEEAHYLYGQYRLAQNQPDQAVALFEQANDYRNHRSYLAHYGLACLHARQGAHDAALDELEKALAFGYPIPEPIYEEPLFKKIRKTKRFKAMLAKNFPPGWENR